LYIKNRKLLAIAFSIISVFIIAIMVAYTALSMRLNIIFNFIILKIRRNI